MSVKIPNNYCVIDGCNSETGQGDGISFFRCPKDYERCQRWKTILGFTGSHKFAGLTPEQCYNRLRICSLHFTDRSFSSQAKKHIKKRAIPSLRLPQNAQAELDQSQAELQQSSTPKENCTALDLLASRLATDSVAFKYIHLFNHYSFLDELFIDKKQLLTVVQQLDQIFNSFNATGQELSTSWAGNFDFESNSDLFFNYIIQIAKTLSPIDQIMLQKDISNIIFDMKIRQLNEPN